MTCGETVLTSPPVVRCAIYTRKSTEEGLEQEFNSLDAQRECAQAYIRSQQTAGWVLLPQRYDDGGFTGANLERPGLTRLLVDIESGRVDCVVIYKVDRLSRSLFDFARLMEIFERRQVSFVSVTQQLNSNTPMGRLTLNVLLSFAQFEREIISERTRDKQSAARRKGKWMGGCPVLGYDPDPQTKRLAVNQAEAAQVREIFAVFGRTGSLTATLEEIASRGIRMKSWTTQSGKGRVGRPLDRAALVRLLTNVLYRGEVQHKGKIYPGEQPASVDRQAFERAGALLLEAQRGGERIERNRQAAALQGLLACGVCGSRMAPGYTTKGGRRYRYYVCLKAQKQGARACPRQIVPAERLEAAVLETLRQAASQPERQKLRGLFGVDREGWPQLDFAQRECLLRSVIQAIAYDGRRGQWRLRLAAEAADFSEGEELSGEIRRKPLSQLLPPRLTEEPQRAAPQRPARITRLMALAVRFEGLLREGTVKDYAELARLGGVTRARITQIMNLRNLAPPIQERILLLGSQAGEPARIHEHLLRSLARHLDWDEQVQRFDQLANSRR